MGGSGVTLCGGGCSFLRLFLDGRALDTMSLRWTLEEPSVLLFLQWLGTGVHFGTCVSLSQKHVTKKILEDLSVLLFLQWLGTGVHFGTCLFLSLRNT
jgi:hypothetical protein